ncbi:hypothetical protein OUZ56_008298 [Daphnia magna]|uniref:Uncharacterized protein n=1 Tax=Daphnia magna TaxID=35525 RepID=A0ABR0ACT6_9CRUS|nr:hypothetical protein OUZ56_008298 [Daphnia magna]
MKHLIFVSPNFILETQVEFHLAMTHFELKKKEGISMRKKKRAFTKKDDILDARKCITMVASILLGSPRCNPSRASPALFCFFRFRLDFPYQSRFEMRSTIPSQPAAKKGNKKKMGRRTEKR